MALLAGGCGGLEIPGLKSSAPPQPPKDLPVIRATFVHELVTKRRIDGLKIEIFNTGSVVAPGGAVSSIKSWRARARLDMPAFLIRHPTQGPIVFDTGLHPDIATMPAKKLGRLRHFFVPFEAAPGQDLVSQLRKAGIEAEGVRWVILSHLHLDHTGAIGAFPNATVLVDRREWEHARAAKPIERLGYDLDFSALESRLTLRLVDLSSAVAYGAFDRAEDLFQDGTIFLVDFSGHTPGSLGLWVNLDEGPVLLAGDATWLLDNHQDLALPLKTHIFDLQKYWRRLFAMRAMQEAAPQLVIFPGHDLGSLKLQPRRDVTLAPFPR